jgi:hypothetical protein
MKSTEAIGSFFWIYFFTLYMKTVAAPLYLMFLSCNLLCSMLILFEVSDFDISLLYE